MKQAFIAGTNIISSLGFSSEENFKELLSGRSGLIFHDKNKNHPLSLIDDIELKNEFEKYKLDTSFSRFENLCALSIAKALEHNDIRDEKNKTLLILASTKGNIGFLEDNIDSTDSIHLWSSAKILSSFFNLKHIPLVISNACISSVLAQIQAVRYIKADMYDNIIVCGADIYSEFVFQGFNSFKALSATACKPFDSKRDGLSLGEGVGTIIFTNQVSKSLFGNTQLVAGASSNDANHISGPSRTGDGLSLAINSTIEQAGIVPEFISAHGTATLYNDEMESKALVLSNLYEVPVNSLKGYFGHTLGAAGIIETIISLFSMTESQTIGTLGHEEYGVSEKINLVSKNIPYTHNSFMKIASGFGACNAALLFKK